MRINKKLGEPEKQQQSPTPENEIVILDDEKNEKEATKDSNPNSNSSAMLVLLNHGDRYSLIKALDDLKPRFVILYHTDICSVRILDTYNALNLDRKLKIYNIYYRGSAEEERYLLSIEKENLAFEKLIREQGVLMIPNEYDVSRESTTKLRDFCLKKDSRATALADEEKSKVIVDMREFNAELPTVLYKNGIDLIAATLEVGDYILSPNFCIERKALDDLAQSLNNGRIFKQIEQMLRHYNQSVLLIESNEKFKNRKVNGGPFQGELSRRSRDTRLLLTMLIRANPKMKILWAGNPRISAGFFEEIKLNEPNPVVDTAVGIRSDDVGELNADESQMDLNQTKKSITKTKVNPVMKRQLEKLPGIGGGEAEKIMLATKFTIPRDVFEADKESLKEIGLSEVQASTLVELFNTDFRYNIR
uniref:ERCC4 domain-containing protein n=1 Tax=Panagrolaimus sp. JU765 TaxID=591449 RepID=A0AC34Q008_9BILA